MLILPAAKLFFVTHKLEEFDVSDHHGRQGGAHTAELQGPAESPQTVHSLTIYFE